VPSLAKKRVSPHTIRHTTAKEPEPGTSPLSLSLAIVCLTGTATGAAPARKNFAAEFREGKFPTLSISIYRGSGLLETARADWIQGVRHLATQPKLTQGGQQHGF